MFFSIPLLRLPLLENHRVCPALGSARDLAVPLRYSNFGHRVGGGRELLLTATGVSAAGLR